jgi:hypothetical protein
MLQLHISVEQNQRVCRNTVLVLQQGVEIFRD